MKFEIWKGKGGWFWRMKADNGEIIAQSESYKNKTDAVYTVSLIQRFAGTAQVKVRAAQPRAPSQRAKRD